MDILTHALSGAAVATVPAVCLSTTAKRKVMIIVAGILGGALPDIDAISMWSKFDATFGRLFQLSHSGKAIYGAKFWYSHHAFFHSLIAGVLIACLLMAIIYAINKWRKRKPDKPFSFFLCTWGLAFVLGYWVHLLGDMPTPASVWGGVNLFWPATTYVGGYGKIWWWNNYDIFLLISICILLNIIVIFMRKFPTRIKKTSVTGILLITALITLWQINSRQVDYAYSGNTSKHSALEQASKEEQERILGKPCYFLMNSFDRLIPFNF
jgi:membrane-bound metal-dependent hydrolase YbcI (DUF457 family)